MMSNNAMPHDLFGGIALIIATALAISLQDVVFKLFSGDLTLWQIFALRGVVAICLLSILAIARHQLTTVIRSAFSVWPILRGLCLTMTFLAFYAAIPFLSLSTVGAANYIAPIFIALLSAFVIGERVGKQGWLGVFLGFAGVLVLLQPGTDAFSAFALLPICGAAFYAAGHIITRTRCQNITAEALAFSLITTMCIAGLVVSATLVVFTPSTVFVESYPYIFGRWSEPDLNDWLVLGVLALFAVSISMMLARAYQIAPPATIGTFEYSYLIFVAIWDILFFETPPTVMSLTGMLMIVGAGLLVMRSRT